MENDARRRQKGKREGTKKLKPVTEAKEVAREAAERGSVPR